MLPKKAETVTICGGILRFH